jgi:hypothetical protein
MKKLRAGITKTTFWILASPVILLMLTGSLTESAEARQRNNLAYASVATLKSQMEDTRGFRVDAMHVTDAGAACVRFHTRDRVGTVSRAQAVIVGKSVARSAGRAGGRDARFEKEWNRQCLGEAHDVTGSVDLFF